MVKKSSSPQGELQFSEGAGPRLLGLREEDVGGPNSCVRGKRGWGPGLLCQKEEGFGGLDTHRGLRMERLGVWTPRWEEGGAGFPGRQGGEVIQLEHGPPQPSRAPLSRILGREGRGQQYI